MPSSKPPDLRSGDAHMRRSTAVFVAAAYLVYASLLTPCRPCLWTSPDLRSSAGEKGHMRRSTAVFVAAAYLVYASLLTPCRPCLCASHSLKFLAGNVCTIFSEILFALHGQVQRARDSDACCCGALHTFFTRFTAANAVIAGAIKPPAGGAGVRPRQCDFCRRTWPCRAGGRRS
jgi:hypothetical protein